MRGSVRANTVFLLLAMAACGRREPRSGQPAELPVNVLADSGRSQRLHVQVPPQPKPKAVVWLVRVSPSRPAPEPALPMPSPEPLESIPDPPRLALDEDLKPPLLRHAGTLRVPGVGSRGAVELDVRVSEEGEVSDALWAGGSGDSSLVAAAVSCALEMRFFPALQAGRPVAVWCRQRFDFGEP